MVICSTSLWSADLTNLAADARRVEPFSERFHLDVADGHYVHNLLFFPDLVLQLRRQLKLPFEVHLMTTRPLDWIDPFVEAGADGFIFCLDSLTDVAGALAAVKAKGKKTGISLLLNEEVSRIVPHLQDLDVLTIVGTAMGIKGASMDPIVPDKIRQAKQEIQRKNLKTEVQADGGIRRETVPLLKQAGVDSIVPGSLMFKEDPAEMRRWLLSC